MDKHDSNLEIIIDRLDKIDNKLDNFQKELLEIKYNTKTDIEKINLRLDTQNAKIDDIEKWRGRSFKDKLFEIATTGALYSFGGIIGVAVFSLFISAFGGNLVTIIKTAISTLL